MKLVLKIVLTVLLFAIILLIGGATFGTYEVLLTAIIAPLVVFGLPALMTLLRTH